MEITSLIRANERLVLPNFTKLSLDYENDCYTFHERFHDYLSVDNSIKANATILDDIIKSFEILDSILDKENPNAIGKGFMEKYKLLRKDMDYDIVFSQVYRLLITLRNTKTHEPNSININGDNVFIERKDKRGNYVQFEAEKNLFAYLLSYAIYYSNMRTVKINYFYKNSIALWYYSVIKSLIFNYIDNGKKISFIPAKENCILTGIGPRYICENIRYDKIGDSIVVKIKPEYLFSLCKKNNIIDFILEIDNKTYMVPYEIMQNGNILISDLQNFEFNGSVSEYLNNFYNGILNINNII
ncbi:MAG: hypothetical protein FWD82_10265 [Defluviitaleaceae bacterium]|nr:hypothetical protein [Defluviitaleaceae bacterium]